MVGPPFPAYSYLEFVSYSSVVCSKETVAFHLFLLSSTSVNDLWPLLSFLVHGG